MTAEYAALAWTTRQRSDSMAAFLMESDNGRPGDPSGRHSGPPVSRGVRPSSDLLDLMAGKFPGIAADVLKPLLELMQVARRVCDGDLDKFVILLVVAVRMAEHPQFRALTPAQLASSQLRSLPSLGTNARSVADSSEIPKETVRRKVGDLIAGGWLVRERSGLNLTPQGYEALAPVRAHIVALVTRNWATASVHLDSAAVPRHRVR